MQAARALRQVGSWSATLIANHMTDPQTTTPLATPFASPSETPSETPPTPAEQTALEIGGEMLERKGEALEGLNKRIARLAIALGLALETDAGLQQALHPVARPDDPHSHASQEELRGLLTLRYQMEKQLVDELGDRGLQHMVAQVEQHMERSGFKHGVDGIHEDQLFDEKMEADPAPDSRPA
jgi:hypothetical protein